MAETWEVINGEELGMKICEMLGIDPHRTSRIVVDIDANHFTKIYIEMIGDKRLLNLKWCDLETRIEERPAP